MREPRPPLRDRLKLALTSTRAGRIALVAPRAAMALGSSGIGTRLARIAAWSVASRETANFTYDTTRESKLLLAATVAAVTRRPAAEVVRHLDELEADTELAAHVSAFAASPRNRWRMDPGFRPGRRLAFYLLARALQPARIVEAGVDKGLGAVLLSRALALNAAEGRPGDYVGIEHDRLKPVALFESYPGRVGRIERGDSLAYLASRHEPIDLFIHDTIAEAAHMRAQLEAVHPLMAAGGVVASTWTTPALIEHALARGLHLLTHQEEPAGHWFPGDRIAFIHGYPGNGGRSRDQPPSSGRA